jgi:hypothetical protein
MEEHPGLIVPSGENYIQIVDVEGIWVDLCVHESQFRSLEVLLNGLYYKACEEGKAKGFAEGVLSTKKVRNGL